MNNSDPKATQKWKKSAMISKDGSFFGPEFSVSLKASKENSKSTSESQVLDGSQEERVYASQPIMAIVFS